MNSKRPGTSQYLIKLPSAVLICLFLALPMLTSLHHHPFVKPQGREKNLTAAHGNSMMHDCAYCHLLSHHPLSFLPGVANCYDLHTHLTGEINLYMGSSPATLPHVPLFPLANGPPSLFS